MKRFYEIFLEETRDILKIIIAGLVVGGLISDDFIHQQFFSKIIFFVIFLIILFISFYFEIKNYFYDQCRILCLFYPKYGCFWNYWVCCNP